MPEKCERSIIHKGRRFDFERVVAFTGEGVRLEHEVVRHPGAVVVLPILGDGRLVLLRNRRIAVGTTLWELPAGLLEPDETPECSARRELIEETGFQAEEMSPLCEFYTTPGLTDELIRVFVATGLKEVGQRLDPSEEIVVHEIGAQEALNMVDDGRIRVATAIVALLAADRRGLLQPDRELASG